MCAYISKRNPNINPYAKILSITFGDPLIMLTSTASLPSKLTRYPSPIPNFKPPNVQRKNSSTTIPRSYLPAH